MFCADESVWIHSTPRASMWQPSGCANATPPLTLPRLSGSACVGSPACRNTSHSKRVAAASPPASRQRTMWPIRFGARGLAASAPSASFWCSGLPLPREVLLLSVT